MLSVCSVALYLISAFFANIHSISAIRVKLRHETRTLSCGLAKAMVESYSSSTALSFSIKFWFLNVSSRTASAKASLGM